MFILTGDIVNSIAPSLKGKQAADIAAWHTEICPQYGINTANIFHEFFANELHESNCFKVLAENLNYKVDALINLFGTKRISVEQASRYGRMDGQIANQVAIANTIYGGSWGKANLGNTQPNDGWDMRGSGPMQITGRDNITGFTNYYNKLTGLSFSPEIMASRLRDDTKTGIHSACWVFAIAKKLIPAAEQDKMRDIVKRINGGYNGIAERMSYLDRCRQLIKDN